MLGRLGMTTEEAIHQYTATASAIFSKANRKPSYKGDTFKATTLETKIKQLVADKGLGERMITDGPASAGNGGGEAHGGRHGCRAFVCAMPARNMAHPQRFRTYAVRANAGPDCLIWQAARATTAAPTFFKRIAVPAAAGHAPQEFVDGGIRCNNPVREVMHEARAVFGGARRLGCLVSLGTGRAVGVIDVPRPDGFEKLLPVRLIRALKNVATDCEEAAQSVARQFGGGGEGHVQRYFRFSVAHGTSGISLEEWQRLDEMTTHTAAYMMDEEVTRSIDRLVKLLCQGTGAALDGSGLTLDNICTS
jgi:hypothetical protein